VRHRPCPDGATEAPDAGRVFEIVREINEQGTTILLVEQNALMALDAAQRGYVMETGRIALHDDAKALRENEQVQKAYLGIE
jgi:branched-chain amino acid transport system ATP-binding protein